MTTCASRCAAPHPNPNSNPNSIPDPKPNPNPNPVPNPNPKPNPDQVRGAPPSDSQLHEALEAAGAAELLADLPEGLDTPSNPSPSSSPSP